MRQMNILIQVGAMLVVHPDNNGVCSAFETTEKTYTLAFPGWLGQALFIQFIQGLAIEKKKKKTKSTFVNKIDHCHLDVQRSTHARIYRPREWSRVKAAWT